MPDHHNDHIVYEVFYISYGDLYREVRKMEIKLQGSHLNGNTHKLIREALGSSREPLGFLCKERITRNEYDQKPQNQE